MGTPYSSRANAVNTVTSVTVKGREGLRTCIDNVVVSYSAAPAGGNLTLIGQSSNRALDVDITAAGPTVIAPADKSFQFAVGEDVVATLAAAGAAVVGKVNLTAYWEKSPADYQL